MGARSTHNRAKTMPFGYDKDDVIKRAKAFFKGEDFIIWKYGKTWNSDYLPNTGFKSPKGSILFTKVGNRYKTFQINETDNCWRSYRI